MTDIFAMNRENISCFVAYSDNTPWIKILNFPRYYRVLLHKNDMLIIYQSAGLLFITAGFYSVPQNSIDSYGVEEAMCFYSGILHSGLQSGISNVTTRQKTSCVVWGLIDKYLWHTNCMEQVIDCNWKKSFLNYCRIIAKFFPYK